LLIHDGQSVRYTPRSEESDSCRLQRSATKRVCAVAAATGGEYCRGGRGGAQFVHNVEPVFSRQDLGAGVRTLSRSTPTSNESANDPHSGRRCALHLVPARNASSMSALERFSRMPLIGRFWPVSEVHERPLPQTRQAAAASQAVDQPRRGCGGHSRGVAPIATKRDRCGTFARLSPALLCASLQKSSNGRCARH
jgi:hypothetical protein